MLYICKKYIRDRSEISYGWVVNFNKTDIDRDRKEKYKRQFRDRVEIGQRKVRDMLDKHQRKVRDKG